MEIKIVPMTEAHLDEVIQIERKVFPSPWSREAFRRELGDRYFSTYLVAEASQKVFGYTGFFRLYNEGHITNLAVQPKFQRRKIGTLLMLELIKIALSEGVKKLTLEVRRSNLAARAFYQKFGFREMGVKKNYYSDTKDDALILGAEDITSPEYQRKLRGIEERTEDRRQS